MAKQTKRELILNKSGGLCWYCGDVLGEGWHVDHFHPIIRNDLGGCDRPENETEENKVPSCASCNLLKSQMNIDDFRTVINNFVSSLNLYSNQYKIAKRYGLIEETKKPVKFWFEGRK